MTISKAAAWSLIGILADYCDPGTQDMFEASGEQGREIGDRLSKMLSNMEVRSMAKNQPVSGSERSSRLVGKDSGTIGSGNRVFGDYSWAIGNDLHVVTDNQVKVDLKFLRDLAEPPLMFGTFKFGAPVIEVWAAMKHSVCHECGKPYTDSTAEVMWALQPTTESARGYGRVDTSKLLAEGYTFTYKRCADCHVFHCGTIWPRGSGSPA